MLEAMNIFVSIDTLNCAFLTLYIHEHKHLIICYLFVFLLSIFGMPNIFMILVVMKPMLIVLLHMLILTC